MAASNPGHLSRGRSPAGTNEALEAHLRRRPVVLNIETTNVCNARCCFCAYTRSKRPKERMSAELFESIVRQYSEMGGGALSLTPIIGDFFLDRLWRNRVEIARRYTGIGMISVTTNGIALNRVSDDDLTYLLRETDFLQLSIGGADRASYRAMFGVDGYQAARESALRLGTLRRRVRPEYPLRLAYRVSDPDAVERSEDFAALRALGYELAVENQFGNWAGVIRQTDLPDGAVLRQPAHYSSKKNPCFVFYLGLFVASSGKATICGCMDADLRHCIGDLMSERLEEVWHKQEYQEAKVSFGTASMPEICKRCSFYEDGVAFSLSPEAMAFESGQYPLGSQECHRPFERLTLTPTRGRSDLLSSPASRRRGPGGGRTDCRRAW